MRVPLLNHQFAGQPKALARLNPNKGERMALSRNWLTPSFSDGPTFTRASIGWRTASDGKTITAYSNDAWRQDSRGLFICGYARQRLTLYPTNVNNWTSISATVTAQAADGSFTPARVASAGAISARYATPTFSLSDGDVVSVRALYKAGNSGSCRVHLRSGTANTDIIVSGTPGALVDSAHTGGTISNIVNTDFGGGLYGVTFTAAVNATQTDYRLGIGPHTTSTGQYVDAYGGQVVKEPIAGEWILGTDTSQVVVAAESDIETISDLGLKSFLASFQVGGWATGVSEAIICQVDDGTEDNRVRLAVTTSTLALHAIVTTGGVDVADLTLGTILLDTNYAAAVSWDADGFVGQVYGNPPVTDASGAVPVGLTTLREAKSTANNEAMVLFRKQQGWRQALTAGQMAGVLASAASPFDPGWFDVDVSDQSNESDAFSIGGDFYSFDTPPSAPGYSPIRRTSLVKNLFQSEVRLGNYCEDDVVAGRARLRAEIRSRYTMDAAQPVWVAFYARAFGVAAASETSEMIFQLKEEVVGAGTGPAARIDCRQHILTVSTSGGGGPYTEVPETIRRYTGAPMQDGVWELFVIRAILDESNGELDVYRAVGAAALTQIVALTGIPVGFDFSHPPRLKFGVYGTDDVTSLIVQYAHIYRGTDLSWWLTRPIPPPSVV